MSGSDAGTLPIVAIVGRPNVGKSALFNRLAGQRVAIVSDAPGTTRDRVSFDASLAGRRYILVDTGGIDSAPTPENAVAPDVQRQTAAAVEDADLLVLVTDVVEGTTSQDHAAAEIVRRAGKPCILAANKADNETRQQAAVEFYELGLGEPLPVSALHGTGIADLLERLAALLPDRPPPEAAASAVRIAIVGRTNVGKSALLNAITGEQRAIVNPRAGTTRDALDSAYRYKGRDLVFVDTAGLRRRGKARPGIEKFGALRTIRAIERAHVAMLVLDASEFVTAQDTHIAGFIEDAARGAVIVVNKWDLAEKASEDEASAVRAIRDRVKFLGGAPVRFTSALAGTGLAGAMDAALGVFDEWTKRVSADDLRRVVMDALAAHPPPTRRRGEVRLQRVLQVKTGPPTFAFHINRPERIHFSYRRYLENRLRKAFGFEGTPLKLEFRAQR